MSSLPQWNSFNGWSWQVTITTRHSTKPHSTVEKPHIRQLFKAAFNKSKPSADEAFIQVLMRYLLKKLWLWNPVTYTHTCVLESTWVFWMALAGKEGVKAVQFILSRWVEAVGMCLREGDNVATRNPRFSAETLCASISLRQLELFQTENCLFLLAVYVVSIVSPQCHKLCDQGPITAMVQESAWGETSP